MYSETLMVQLTRLSHHSFVLNCDLIELIETTPDTVISLTTGQKILVRETPAEIIECVKEYKRSIMRPASCHEIPQSLEGRTGSSEERVNPEGGSDGGR